MTNDTINDTQTIAGNAEGNPSAEKGTPMDKSIGDGPTMRPKEERGGRGAFAPGDVIAGRYVIERMLGEGGMGIVYQCLDKVGGVSVAVKCLPPDVSRTADEMEDIRANYRLVSGLHHPNIASARTLELDESTGDYYLVMDLAHGASIKRWMKRHPQATMEAKLAILRQVAAALDYAHAQKVIHRDVKPENVMVDDEGGVKVLDFGLAAQIRSSQSRTSNAVTSKGGTPGYKSPEQWRGKPQRESADVYSFGVMAYWMFAGVLPFDGDDPVVLGHAVLTEPVEPIAGLPAHMNAALMKALAKQPDERFASCGAVVDALEGKDIGRVEGNDFTQRRREAETQSGRARCGRARSPSAPEEGDDFGHKERKKRKGVVGKVFAVVALLAAIAGGGYYGWAKYDEGVKAREAKQAEARARIEKETEERIARLKAEKKEKIEAEKRKVEAEQEARQKEVARLAELRVDIGIKCEDAKEKIGRIAAYRGEPDGFKAHIDNADANWKIVEAVEKSPVTVADAEKAFESATKAENAIAKELHWLSTNKAARDGAKATEAEIARVVDPELKRFKADDYARDLFGAGDRLRIEGNAALANGDFPTAKRKLDEAKAKLSDAAVNAKKFCIDTHLNAAKKWLAASKWQQCVEECDTVLGWDSDNAEAKKIKAEAESQLVPMAKVVAKIDGREVPGAKLNDGTKIHATPINWKLEDGKKYGPYNVTYESGGKRYYGTFDAVTVDWQGMKEISVTMKEYIRPKPPASVPGKDDLDSLLDELKFDLSRNSAEKSVPVSAATTASARPRVQLWEGGPYWATTNIGAEKPEDYGYYFWWGDTVGYKRVNGTWVASDGSSSNFSFSKENTPTFVQLQAEGWITAEGVLVSKHDVAHMQWGGGWRMPTKQELDDLSSKCDWKWTTVNGVIGYSIHGRGAYASASIFLPCAGLGNGTSLYYSGSYGYYWSSVPNSDNYYSWYLDFYSGYHDMYYNFGRYYGFSVRPVQGFTK